MILADGDLTSDLVPRDAVASQVRDVVAHPAPGLDVLKQWREFAHGGGDGQDHGARQVECQAADCLATAYPGPIKALNPKRLAF